MTRDANAIVTLCSHLCKGDGVNPLLSKEWNIVAEKLIENNLRPEDIFDMSFQQLHRVFGISPEYAERILRLIDRNASLFFELTRYKNMGISVITRADEDYHGKLKKKTKASMPAPILLRR